MSPREQGWVVCKSGKDGTTYLDDTGTGVHDPAEAKHFLTELDAHAGIYIAELAPTGGLPSEWRIERLH